MTVKSFRDRNTANMIFPPNSCAEFIRNAKGRSIKILMKRPPTMVVGMIPDGLFFVLFFTASLFRLISCCFSKLEKELNEHRQTTKLLVYQGLFRLSLLYRNGILLPHS